MGNTDEYRRSPAEFDEKQLKEAFPAMQKAQFYLDPTLDKKAFRATYYMQTDPHVSPNVRFHHHKAKMMWLLHKCGGDDDGISRLDPYVRLWEATFERYFLSEQFEKQEAFVEYLWETREKTDTC
jgi:hypothetical protein